MRQSRRGQVDPFIVMDVMEAARQAEAAGRHIIHMEVGQPSTPAPARARAALAAALEAGTIAGAGLDVFEREPEVSPRLLQLPNVVLLPHLGSATIEGRLAMGEKVIANIRVFADGHRPPDQVLEGWA